MCFISPPAPKKPDMVLRICVPPTHSPWARNWNCASGRWSPTAAMVATSLGVSTPFIGTGCRFAGAAVISVVALMVVVLGSGPCAPCGGAGGRLLW